MKLLVPSPDGPTNLYPGEATLRICVNTQSSIHGVGALGCGTLQVVIR